ncbi:hypothetical protein C8Q78DRAFT_1049002 [Trametes maxima]|nr:hypothetical protein C8Q78DRAFT_1049002 [Trametes maxima]
MCCVLTHWRGCAKSLGVSFTVALLLPLPWAASWSIIWRYRHKLATHTYVTDTTAVLLLECANLKIQILGGRERTESSTIAFLNLNLLSY